MNQDDNTKSLNEDWEINNVELSSKDGTPIKVKINNINNRKHINFSLNEQFTLSNIVYQDKTLKYTRKDNIVKVETEGVPYITILYDETIGTSIYPVLNGMTYLPFQSNWYPQKRDINHYELDADGNIEPNVDIAKCDDLMIVQKSNFKWDGNQTKCLSIIDGPYHNFIFNDIQFIVYIPFLTKTENYSELIRNINKVNDEICKFSKRENNCPSELVKSISIIPKSLSTSHTSVFDAVNINGHYTFNVNLFTDVGYKPITKHLSELLTVQIAHQEFKEDTFSLLFGQYLLEVLNIEALGNIDLLVEENGIDINKWNEYKNYSISEKKKLLLENL